MNDWSRAVSAHKADNSAVAIKTVSGNRGLQIEEALIFEQDSPGHCGVDLPEPAPIRSRLGGLERQSLIGLPGLSEPQVVAVYRLAISEADRSPEVGRSLDRYGSQAACSALREILEGARSAGLLTENADLAELVGASRQRTTEQLNDFEREQVIIRDGRRLVATVRLRADGTAVVSLRGLSSGRHRLTAHYAGSATVATSVSATRTVTVRPAPRR